MTSLQCLSWHFTLTIWIIIASQVTRFYSKKGKTNTGFYFPCFQLKNMQDMEKKAERSIWMLCLEATRRCSTWATLDLHWWHRNEILILLYSQLLKTASAEVLKCMLFCRRHKVLRINQTPALERSREHIQKSYFLKKHLYFTFTIPTVF